MDVAFAKIVKFLLESTDDSIIDFIQSMKFVAYVTQIIELRSNMLRCFDKPTIGSVEKTIITFKEIKEPPYSNAIQITIDHTDKKWYCKLLNKTGTFTSIVTNKSKSHPFA